MKPDPFKTKNVSPGHTFEFGVSTWDIHENSIRNRYDNKVGKFNRFGSSEIPVKDFLEMIRFSAEKDLFAPHECAAMMDAFANSIRRHR